jgi:hypothetical protein
MCIHRVSIQKIETLPCESPTPNSSLITHPLLLLVLITMTLFQVVVHVIPLHWYWKFNIHKLNRPRFKLLWRSSSKLLSVKRHFLLNKYIIFLKYKIPFFLSRNYYFLVSSLGQQKQRNLTQAPPRLSGRQ